MAVQVRLPSSLFPAISSLVLSFLHSMQLTAPLLLLLAPPATSLVVPRPTRLFPFLSLSTSLLVQPTRVHRVRLFLLSFLVSSRFIFFVCKPRIPDRHERGSASDGHPSREREGEGEGRERERDLLSAFKFKVEGIIVWYNGWNVVARMMITL